MKKIIIINKEDFRRNYLFKELLSQLGIKRKKEIDYVNEVQIHTDQFSVYHNPNKGEEDL